MMQGRIILGISAWSYPTLRPPPAELAPDRLRCFGVYLGERPAHFGAVTVLPCLEFLRRLWADEIIRP